MILLKHEEHAVNSGQTQATHPLIGIHSLSLVLTLVGTEPTRLEPDDAPLVGPEFT